MIDSIIAFLKGEKETPDNVCANCWGTQEYANEIKNLVEDKQIDINNHSASKTFIQQFVEDRLDGITLKNVDGKMTCPTCNTRF